MKFLVLSTENKDCITGLYNKVRYSGCAPIRVVNHFENDRINEKVYENDIFLNKGRF